MLRVIIASITTTRHTMTITYGIIINENAGPYMIIYNQAIIFFHITLYNY